MNWSNDVFRILSVHHRIRTTLPGLGSFFNMEFTLPSSAVVEALRYKPGKNVKDALSRLFDTDAYRHIVSLPLTEFTPLSPEALHTKQA
jgi:hypothetical protein